MTVLGFHQLVEGIAGEVRLELIREAKFSLAEWERTRCPEARGRLLAALEQLALLVKAG